MTTITGTGIQTELNTTLAVATIETIIDSAVDTVNSDAGLAIGYMTGVTPNKQLVVTGEQAAAIKPMVAMKLIIRSTSGASSASYTIGPVGTSQSTSSTQNDINAEQYDRAIKVLIGNDFRRA